VGLTTPHRKKKQFVTKLYTGSRIKVGFCEHGKEPSGPSQEGLFSME